MWASRHLCTCPRADPNGGDGGTSSAAINIHIIPTAFEAAAFFAIVVHLSTVLNRTNILIFYLMPTVLQRHAYNRMKAKRKAIGVSDSLLRQTS